MSEKVSNTCMIKGLFWPYKNAYTENPEKKSKNNVQCEYSLETAVPHREAKMSVLKYWLMDF